MDDISLLSYLLFFYLRATNLILLEHLSFILLPKMFIYILLDFVVLFCSAWLN